MKPAFAREAPSRTREYATLFDLEKCIGCGECVQACRQRNAGRHPVVRKPLPELFPPGTKAEDWSERRGVDDRLTPYNWLFIESVDVQEDGNALTLHIPRRCMHCLNPPCANLCPWGAAGRNPETGTVDISAEICLGGAKCRVVCPWHVPQRQSGVGLYLDIMPRFGGNGVMYKCDRCADSFARGEPPACVEVCPEQVQSIGPRDVILAEAKNLAEKRGHYLYGVTDNGGSNTFYLSPVSFETLARHSQSGPGRPTLAPVPNSMADAENLTRMLLTAPVAGLAAGWVRFARSVGRGENPSPGQAAPPEPGAENIVERRLPEAGMLKKLWVTVALVLGFTGMMQMPVASRYGLAKIPGLVWTGDFFATLYLHYVFAGLLLALGAYWLALRIRKREAFPRLTGWGNVRLALIAGLVGSGMLRALKNLSDVTFEPGFTTTVDLAHLGLAVALGAASLALRITGRGAWIADPRT